MNDQSKSKKELIKELHELQQENSLLNSLHDNDKSRCINSAEALLKTNSRLILAMQGGNMAWWEMDIPTGNVTFDKRKVEMLGYSPENFKHYEDFTVLLHPQDYNRIMRTMKGHLDGETDKYEAEYRILTKSGEYKWFYDYGSVIKKDTNGKPLICCGFVFDINERKKAENKMLYICKAIESTSDAIAISDAQCHHFYQNKALSDLFGYKTAVETEAAGGGPAVIKDPAVAKEMFDNIMNGKPWSGELELVKKNGVIFPAYERADAIMDNEGNLLGVIGIITDITRHKQTEEKTLQLLAEAKLAHCKLLSMVEDQTKTEVALRYSETRLQTLIQTIPDLLWLKDPNGMYLSCNTMFERFFGAKEADIVGKSDYDFVDIELAGFFRENDLKVMAKGKPSINEEWITFADDGHRSFLQTIKTPMYDATGILIGVLGIGRDVTEHKQIESDLKEKMEDLTRMAIVVRDSNDAVIMHDLKGEIFAWNRGAKETYGYTEAEALRMNIRDIVPETDREAALTLIEKIKNGAIIKSFELKRVTKDGRILDVWLTKTLLTNELGKPVAIATTERDITERKRSDQKLKKSEAQFKDFFENAADAIFIAENESGRIVDANNAASLLMQMKHDRIIGMHQSQLHPMKLEPIAIDNFTRHLQEAKQKSSSHLSELEILRSDGTTVPVEILTSNVTLNGKQCLMGTFRDITERRKADELLRINKQRQESLVKAIPDMIFSLNRHGIFTDFHGELKKGLIMLPELFIGKHFSEILPPNVTAKFEVAIENATQTKNITTFTYNLLIPEGIINSYEARVSLLPEHGCIVIVRDITEIKQAELELIAAKDKAEESDRLKSAFLANMSHEIPTPMNGILGFAGLLKEPHLTGEEQQEYIQVIEKSGKRMLNIINDIVSISKVESGQMEVSMSETNVNTQIEYIYTFFKPEAAQKGIQLLFKRSLLAKDAIIITDREKLYAILMNLLKNALKFTDKGVIEFGYVKKDKCLEFYVKDTGTGIGNEKKKFIFERFRQGNESLSRNYEGAGLGLSISKAYVEMLGGKIWVESQEGRGSVFYFTIPSITAVQGKDLSGDLALVKAAKNKVKKQ